MNFRRRIVACEVWKIVVTSLIYFCNITKCSIPCELSYGGCKQQQQHPQQHHYVASYFSQPMYNYKHTPPTFVPSPPGKIPQCARPGFTFCEKIDRYPVDLISTLAAKTNYNFKTLFASGGSTGRKVETHTTLRFNNENAHYPLPNGQVHATFNPLNNFNQSSQQEGYPDRQYPFDEASAHLVDPVLYSSFRESSPYNPSDWWKRSERSDSNTDGKRKRRQIPPAGIELCPTRSQFVMPRAAVNARGEWKYVVNVDQGPEKYTQLVRSEICVSETCNGICSLPNGYTSRCEQKYVMKRLVALEGTGSHLYTDVFWFPHCCVCQIQPDIR